MLSLNEDQFDGMAVPKRQALMKWIEEHLKEYFPDRANGMTTDELSEFVQECCEVACDLGITDSTAMVKFTDMTFVYGKDFHLSANYPLHVRIINDTAIADPNMRVELMAKIIHNE